MTHLSSPNDSTRFLFFSACQLANSNSGVGPVADFGAVCVAGRGLGQRRPRRHALDRAHGPPPHLPNVPRARLRRQRLVRAAAAAGVEGRPRALRARALR